MIVNAYSIHSSLGRLPEHHDFKSNEHFSLYDDVRDIALPYGEEVPHHQPSPPSLLLRRSKELARRTVSITMKQGARAFLPVLAQTWPGVR